MHAELRSTYRIQLSRHFDLYQAAAITGYLADLGVSHVYLSPILQAGTDSEHGYDVTDPTRIWVSLGGEKALHELFAALRQHGMAAIIDLVPNHLAATSENPWWRDLLRQGQASPHSDVFDINWDPPDPELKGKVLLPILGDHLCKVLANEEITLSVKDDEWCLCYFDHCFPINEEGLKLIATGKADIDHILEIQFYRLAYWRIGPDEINYRRFFDIQGLVGIQVEHPHVFDATHRKLLEIAMSGPVDGIRIDHPDGLRDPLAYFQRLKQSIGDKWLLVEKILESGEKLPRSWPVDGTTGYDFLQRVGGLFILPSGEKPISDFYADFTGHSEPYGSLVREKKRKVLESAFGADIRRLVECFKQICGQPGLRLDHSRNELRLLFIEILASFPVYRTYVNPGDGKTSMDDRAAIRLALASTRRRAPPFDEALIDLLEITLSGDAPPEWQADDFVARFQQLTGPVMAKGVEDTTFYSYDRLLALNEVGCDPARFGVSVQAFHEACVVAHRDWPQAMLTTSTHDTKRGEDVRARLALLSELAGTWADKVREWSDMNFPAWKGREPDRNAEHLLYQTLVGAWPIEVDRVECYMRKACREAKVHTSWIRPNESYEARIHDFTRGVIDNPTFVENLEEFVNPLIPLGRINSLAQTLLKLSSPGIPDIYQGCEIWDNSLVDPDNRRPVDYELRRNLLNSKDHSDEKLPKLRLIRTCLEVRKQIPDAFSIGPSGEYRPLLVYGDKLTHIVGFCRGGKVAIAVPRLVHTLGNDWGNTVVALPPGRWMNRFDQSVRSSSVPAIELFQAFPVALLIKL
jgi:(1->4)-alpha-D-glucan 1-alpha-D-glucosylmutase